MYYLLLIMCITVAGFLLGMQQKEKKMIRLFLVFSFLCIGVMIAFRDVTVGADTESYMKWFTETRQYASAERFPFEPGNYYLFSALQHISKDPQIIFVFEAIVVGVCYGCFIYKNVDTVLEAYIAVLSYLAFQLFSFNLCGYRQSIAMCICVVAYELIKKKKLVWFVLVIAFAAQFHSSAWMFLAAYIISLGNAQYGKLIAAVFTVFSVFNFEKVFEFATLLDDRYEKYGMEETGNGFIFFAVLLVITLFAEIGKSKENDLSIRQIDKMININYFTLGLWVLRLFTRTAERPAMYFFPATMIVTSSLPKMFVDKMEKHTHKIFVSAICVFLIILFFVRSIRTPYSFCW